MTTETELLEQELTELQERMAEIEKEMQEKRDNKSTIEKLNDRELNYLGVTDFNISDFDKSELAIEIDNLIEQGNTPTRILTPHDYLENFDWEALQNLALNFLNSVDKDRKLESTVGLIDTNIKIVSKGLWIEFINY